MICESHFRLKKDGKPDSRCFCKDVTRIENYSKAVLDTTQVWECHHRLETHYLERGKWVRREEDVSRERLIEDGKYFDVPPEELIFLTKAEHNSLHKKGQKRTDGAGRPPRKVLCIETGEIFESAHEASRKTGVDFSHISQVCRGKHKNAGGYHWAYAPIEIED